MAGLLALAAYAALAWQQQRGGVHPAQLIVASAVIWLAMLAAIRACPAPGWRLVFGFAIAFRLVGLWGGPILEDDYFRYLWDGYRLLSTGSPYGAAPADSFGDAGLTPQLQAVLSGINHPGLPTIYGPTLQWLFAAAYALGGGHVLGLQALFSVVDTLLLCMLWRLAGDKRWVWLYAWCPLVVTEIAFTAHPDGVLGLLMFAACVLRSRGQPMGAAVVLGMALAAKPVAIIIAPYVLWRSQWRAWMLAGLTLMAAYLPFVLQGAAGWFSLQVFAEQWVFNPALYALLQPLWPGHARALGVLAFLALWAAMFVHHMRRPDATRCVPRIDLLVIALLAWSPVINPWYLLWALPFAALHPSRTVWVASATLLLAYAHGVYWPELGARPFELPAWLSALEFLPVAIAAAWDYRDPLPNGRAAGPRSASRPMQARMP